MLRHRGQGFRGAFLGEKGLGFKAFRSPQHALVGNKSVQMYPEAAGRRCLFKLVGLRGCVGLGTGCSAHAGWRLSKLTGMYNTGMKGANNRVIWACITQE